MESSTDRWLEDMHAVVCRQHELVSFLRELHPPADMQFRPLPPEMRARLATSPDWQLPEPGTPTTTMLETADESGGLIPISDADGHLFVLAPA